MDRPAPLTVGELAAELRCPEDEVRALIRAGELRTVACGIRPGRVPRHEVDAYLRRLRHELDGAGPATPGSAPRRDAAPGASAPGRPR